MAMFSTLLKLMLAVAALAEYPEEAMEGTELVQKERRVTDVGADIPELLQKEEQVQDLKRVLAAKVSEIQKLDGVMKETLGTASAAGLTPSAAGLTKAPSKQEPVKGPAPAAQEHPEYQPEKPKFWQDRVEDSNKRSGAQESAAKTMGKASDEFADKAKHGKVVSERSAEAETAHHQAADMFKVAGKLYAEASAARTQANQALVHSKTTKEQLATAQSEETKDMTNALDAEKAKKEAAVREETKEMELQSLKDAQVDAEGKDEDAKDLRKAAEAALETSDRKLAAAKQKLSLAQRDATEAKAKWEESTGEAEKAMEKSSEALIEEENLSIKFGKDQSAQAKAEVMKTNLDKSWQLAQEMFTEKDEEASDAVKAATDSEAQMRAAVSEANHLALEANRLRQTVDSGGITATQEVLDESQFTPQNDEPLP